MEYPEHYWLFVINHMPYMAADACMKDITKDRDGLSNDSYNTIKTKYEIAESSRIAEIVGHSISFVAIVMSIWTFVTFQKQLNRRFQLHTSLFSMMLVQTVIYLILYLDREINFAPESRSIANIENLCVVIYATMEYSATGTFFWFLLEGYDLNNQISKSALQEPVDLKYYYVLGFGFPAVITGVWLFINYNYYAEKNLNTCWFGYNFSESYWVLQAPRLIVIVINIFILCRVMKTIVSKLSANKTSEFEKVRKSVKAALMLLPLLGVTNIFNTFDISPTTSITIFTLWCYSRALFKSLQGVLLSIVYCLFRAEVRVLIMRRMKRMNIFGLDIFAKRKMKQRKKKNIKLSTLPTITGNENKDDEQRIIIEICHLNIRPAESSDTDSEEEENITKNLNTTIMEETSFCHLCEGNTELLI